MTVGTVKLARRVCVTGGRACGVCTRVRVGRVISQKQRGGADGEDEEDEKFELYHFRNTAPFQKHIAVEADEQNLNKEGTKLIQRTQEKSLCLCAYFVPSVIKANFSNPNSHIRKPRFGCEK
jgi:hypothetical protein